MAGSLFTNVISAVQKPVRLTVSSNTRIDQVNNWSQSYLNEPVSYWKLNPAQIQERQFWSVKYFCLKYQKQGEIIYIIRLLSDVQDNYFTLKSWCAGRYEWVSEDRQGPALISLWMEFQGFIVFKMQLDPFVGSVLWILNQNNSICGP